MIAEARIATGTESQPYRISFTPSAAGYLFAAAPVLPVPTRIATNPVTPPSFAGDKLFGGAIYRRKTRNATLIFRACGRSRGAFG